MKAKPVPRNAPRHDMRERKMRDWTSLERDGWMFEPVDATYRPRAQASALRSLAAFRGYRVSVRLADDEHGTAGYLVEVL